jgi:hypothetical protein
VFRPEEERWLDVDAGKDVADMFYPTVDASRVGENTKTRAS